MGYTTDFKGVLKLNKQLTEEDETFLRKLNSSRRMKLKVDAKYGVEGEFYVEDDVGSFFKGYEKAVIDNNEPPSTQPGLWCQWVPTEDGDGLEWDGGEKAYNMEDWIFYIINRYLAPRGYIVNGTVDAFGEEAGDIWAIRVEDNVVRIAAFRNLHDRSAPNWEKTKWEKQKKIPMTVKEKKPKKVKIEKTLVRGLVDRKSGEKFLNRSDLIKYLDASARNFKGDKNAVALIAILKDNLMEF